MGCSEVLQGFVVQQIRDDSVGKIYASRQMREFHQASLGIVVEGKRIETCPLCKSVLLSQSRMAFPSTTNDDNGTLELSGNKWNATSYTTTLNKTSTIPITITSQSQSANILDCSNYTFHITYSGAASTSTDSISPHGKCVAITIDNCRNCTVLVDLMVLSSIEVINSKKCKVQVLSRSSSFVFYFLMRKKRLCVKSKSRYLLCLQNFSLPKNKFQKLI